MAWNHGPSLNHAIVQSKREEIGITFKIYQKVILGYWG